AASDTRGTGQDPTPGPVVTSWEISVLGGPFKTPDRTLEVLPSSWSIEPLQSAKWTKFEDRDEERGATRSYLNSVLDRQSSIFEGSVLFRWEDRWGFPGKIWP